MILTSPELFVHRHSRARVYLLDSDDQIIRELGTVVDGQVDSNAFRTVQRGGTLTVLDDGLPFDPLSNRIRVAWEVEGLEPWSLGVYLLEQSQVAYSAVNQSWDMSLLGKSTILDQWLMPATSFAAGAYPTDLVESLIEMAGESHFVVPSNATLTNPAVWEAGTPRLKIINDLLAMVGYGTLHASPAGVFQAQPYVLPQDRPVVFVFQEGSRAIHLAEWTREQDLFNVPNRMIVTSQADGEDPPLESVVDLPITNPFSSAPPPDGRGRVIPDFEDNVAITTQEALDTYARQALLAKVSPVANLYIEHVPLPLQVNDAVEFHSQGYNALCTVTETSQTLAPGGLQSTRLREVVRL